MSFLTIRVSAAKRLSGPTQKEERRNHIYGRATIRSPCDFRERRTQEVRDRRDAYRVRHRQICYFVCSIA
jgi:hypothetical protein